MDQNILKKLREIQIELLDEFVRICDENNFCYNLTAGTLLGAVRHKGFIPWDDDVDLAMPRSDYEKFIIFYNNIKDSNYYIITNNCPVNTYYHYCTFTKFCKKNTVFQEIVRKEEDYCGIFIDIWPYDNAFLLFTRLQTFLIKSGLKLYRMKTYTSSTYIARNNPKLKIFLNKILPKWLCVFIYNITKNLYSAFNNCKTKYISFFSGTALNYKKNTHKYNDMYPLSKVQFENKYYYAPNNYHKFLETTYGDYMKLPPVEDQKIHGKHIVFDTYNENNN